jgi:hypothetical protein
VTDTCGPYLRVVGEEFLEGVRSAPLYCTKQPTERPSLRTVHYSVGGSLMHLNLKGRDQGREGEVS